MPANPTRTLNPLPFEHLEPKRFEDLARQLAYDFKPWRQLEATGRGGADDGFDARGFEIVTPQGGIVPSEETEDYEGTETLSDRLWLIQCKREKAIGPLKMKAYLDGLPAESLDGLYGILFVACCDLSKKTRDTFRLWCSEHNIAEGHIWGKAEIEDLLFQPKNDNLLFAYFGISLQIRRQRITVNLRRITTVKRKLRRIIEDHEHGDLVIVRDVSDERYPYTDDLPLEESDFLWRICHVEGLGVRGLRILSRKHAAFYDRKTEQWDIATKINRATLKDYENPWHADTRSEEQKDLEMHQHEFWVSIPDAQRAEITFVSEIAYSDILEVDDVGDNFSELPIIYVAFQNGELPILDHLDITATSTRGFHDETHRLHKETHLRVFPDQFRDIEWEENWAARNGLDLHANKGEIKLEPPDWIVRNQKVRAGEDPDAGDDTEGAETV